MSATLETKMLSIVDQLDAGFRQHDGRVVKPRHIVILAKASIQSFKDRPAGDLFSLEYSLRGNDDR